MNSPSLSINLSLTILNKLPLNPQAWPFKEYLHVKHSTSEGLSDTLRLELANEKNIFVILLNTGPIISNFRNKAKQMLVKNVDIKNSRFSEIYKKSLKKQKSDVPFTLPAIEVAKVVKKIILSPKPKPRYYITKATYLLGFAKRILPTSLLDKILLRI